MLAGEDLASLMARVTDLELQEDERRATIIQLKNKLKEQVTKNKDLQEQVEGHQDQLTLLGHHEAVHEHKSLELRDKLKDNR